MDADFAVELGAEDETLEMPWTDEATGLHYVDLKRHPELLGEVEETKRSAELGDFLAAINSRSSALETAKCDFWFTTELNPEEEIFGASGKFGSYVELLFSDERRFSFPEHERFVKTLTQLLGKAPEISAAAEFLVRRCYFHVGEAVKEGLYITFYLFGYGDDEAQARERWDIGLKLVQNALRQISG